MDNDSDSHSSDYADDDAHNDPMDLSYEKDTDGPIPSNVKLPLGIGRDRKKAAANGIQGLALDRVGLREEALIPGSFVNLISAWSRKLVELGTKPIESLSALPTFGLAVHQQVGFSLTTFSKKPYVQLPPEGYVFAQNPRELLSPAEEKAGYPMVPGLTVTVIRLVGKADAPATKSFFLDDKKGVRSKPFKLTRGNDAPRSLVPPASRLTELANQTALIATATILFPKQGLGEGGNFTDATIRSQGGAMAFIFSPAKLCWAIFLDFSSASAITADRAAIRVPVTQPPRPADNKQQQQTVVAQTAFKGYSNIHSDKGSAGMNGSGGGESQWATEVAPHEEDILLNETRKQMERLKIETATQEEKSYEATTSSEEEDNNEAAEPATKKASSAAIMNAVNVSMVKELTELLTQERSQLWVDQATRAAMLMVNDVYRYNLLSVLQSDTTEKQTAMVLWVATIVRMSTRAVLTNIGNGVYHDMAVASPTAREFIMSHHTPGAMVLTATTLLNTSILLRWSNLERCKKLHKSDVSRGIPCGREVLSRNESAMGKFSSFAFSMEPERALKVAGIHIPTIAAGVGWQKHHASHINTLVDDLMGQIYLYLAGAGSESEPNADFALARSFAVLIRAKVFAWMGDHDSALSSMNPLFALQAVAYLNLVLTGCAYELLCYAGIETARASKVIDDSDNVATEQALVILNNSIRDLLDTAAPRIAPVVTQKSSSLGSNTVVSMSASRRTHVNTKNGLASATVVLS
jgi:hypothetical protein